MTELEIVARQRYLSCLSRSTVHIPVEKTFPGMPSTHVIYVKAVKKTLVNLKNWKTRTLERLDKAMNEWISDLPDDELRVSTYFNVLKTAMSKDYQYHWVTGIFTSFTCVIDFSKVTPLGQRWLKCKFSLSSKSTKALLAL